MANGSCAYCGGPVPREHSKYCSQACMGLDRKTSVKVTCPCGVVFEVQPSAFKRPRRGRYCSKACMYRFRTRPRGLKYVKHKDNPTSFKPGERSSPDTEFKPGLEPWNKGKSEADPSTWVRESVEGYVPLHREVYKLRGAASSYSCTRLDETCKGPLHWANISHQYLGVEDFMVLCQSHHERYDRTELL